MRCTALGIARKFHHSEIEEVLEEAGDKMS